MSDIFKIDSTSLENLCRLISRGGESTIVIQKNGNAVRKHMVEITDLEEMIKQGKHVWVVGDGDDRPAIYAKFFRTSIVIANTEDDAKSMFLEMNGKWGGSDGEEDHNSVVVVGQLTAKVPR